MLHARCEFRRAEGGRQMRILGTIMLAASLSLATGAAFAQVNAGGHSSAASSVRGGSTTGTGNANAGVNAGGGRNGARIGVGGHGTHRLSTGIGNSRVNSAISGQGRGHGRGR